MVSFEVKAKRNWNSSEGGGLYKYTNTTHHFLCHYMHVTLPATAMYFTFIIWTEKLPNKQKEHIIMEEKS